MSVIQRIKELYDTAKSGNYYDVKNAEYDILYTVLPQLIQEHEALLRFVEAIRSLDPVERQTQFGVTDESKITDHTVRAVNETIDVWKDAINTALQALDKELKG